MVFSATVAYTLASVLLALVNLYYAGKSFQKRGKTGRSLGYAAISATAVNLAYLASITTRDYTRASVFSSIYFIAIDCMLVSLVHFAALYTHTIRHRQYPAVQMGLRLYSAFDIVVMLINIYREIAIHYVPRDGEIACFAYQMKPLYLLHLAYTYLLVLLVLIIMVEKALRAPRQYRNQYVYIIAAILMVVLMNAMFLFLESSALVTHIDISILGYSLGLYFMYWSAFEYREKTMLESFSMTIFSQMDRGIVLFDYEGRLIMKNPMAEQLLSGVAFERNMLLSAFQAACELPADRPGDAYTIQLSPLQCDFRRMRDEHDTVIGNLFVFTDLTRDSDPLTGFVLWEKFQSLSRENARSFAPPTAVAVVDIIGLDAINREAGRDEGDRRLRRLAEAFRAQLPQGANLMRGYDANLIGVVDHATEEALRPRMEALAASCGEAVAFGLCAASGEGGLDQAIRTALRSMQVKKLLDPRSARSQALTSLVRALQAADSDTEAHVRRTRRMGDLLGRRIGLSDAELGNLQLLCLLHDIGKVGIPLEILNKPGRLTDAEWAMLRSHVDKGYQIAMSSDELKPIASMILHHHERWDGKGYPSGLSGEDIPLLSRIIAIVDAYDAMVNNRAYHKGTAPEEAQRELERSSGAHFDPALTQAFIALLKENPDMAAGEITGGEGPRAPRETRARPIVGECTTVPVPYCRYLLDLDDCIVEIDQSFEEMTGYSWFDVLNRRLRQFDLIPAEERENYGIQVNNQFARADIAFLEHDLLRKDGSRLRVYCLGKHYYDSALKTFRSEIIIVKAQA